MTTSHSTASFRIPHQRFSDVENEPRKYLLPISGYQTTPLVSLEEAITPVKHLLDEDIDTKVYIAKQNCKEPKDGLTQNESAALQLYTMEGDNSNESLYLVLNQTLRAESRRRLKIWFPFLKLLLTGLWKLPNQKMCVYRGVNADLSEKLNIGDTVVWWGFSSCTKSLDVLQSEQFLTKSGTRTLFNVECYNGKFIRNHSFYEAEDEVLLLPATQLVVASKLSPAPGLHIIHVKELKNPPVQLLKPPFVEDSKVSRKIGEDQRMSTPFSHSSVNNICINSNSGSHVSIINNGNYATNACDRIQRKHYPVSSFDCITLDGGFDVQLSHSYDKQSVVEIETYESLHTSRCIQTVVENKTLGIRLGSCSYSVMKVFIQMPSLRCLTANGSGQIVSTNTLLSAADTLQLFLHGSSNVNLAVDVNSLQVRLHGSGSLKLQGKVQNVLQLECHGSGMFDGAHCAAEVARATLQGSCTAYIVGVKAVHLSIGGVSNAFYRGPLKERHVGGSSLARQF
ncbi:unnamed protein product [Adineta ricciae]|uniref:NAD(P)(+)--arginine ADP-ribosyltransferase n=1 Tax=Adineta ricciae TaxID=249248 RepID=A0A815C774_ADIRI|nr:unnamed protein product [Adineta ricciae]CAF1598764.1 unnamed protein product [Adineta ricciae]